MIPITADDIGTTPDSIRRIVQCKHKVEVKKSGYKVWNKMIDVEAGEETRIHTKLE